MTCVGIELSADICYAFMINFNSRGQSTLL
jgi:hypothetical protein